MPELLPPWFSIIYKEIFQNRYQKSIYFFYIKTWPWQFNYYTEYSEKRRSIYMEIQSVIAKAYDLYLTRSDIINFQYTTMRYQDFLTLLPYCRKNKNLFSHDLWEKFLFTQKPEARKYCLDMKHFFHDFDEMHLSVEMYKENDKHHFHLYVFMIFFMFSYTEHNLKNTRFSLNAA